MYKFYSLIFFLFSLSIFSQDFSEEKMFSWYDQQKGLENSTLLRGIEYVETDRMINEKHKFFISQEFQIGNLTYDGQTFYNVPLKYNIYEDILLANLQWNQSNLIFQLIGEKVSQFQINESRFRYFDGQVNNDVTGFYESIYEEGDFKIFKKHYLSRSEVRDSKVAYIEFEPRNPKYVFHIQNDFFDLNNRRSLYIIFPNLKSEIKEIYKKYAEEEKNNPDAFMKTLAREMNILILQTSKEMQE